MKRGFNKMLQLFAFLGAAGFASSEAFKSSDKGKKQSLSKYAQSNFTSLPLKRVKGKWRVRA